MSQQSRREIVFSARDNGVADMMSRLSQSANQLGRELVREAMENSSSAQEAVKYYEQQVRLIEKKTKLEQRSQRASAQSRFDRLSQQEGVDQDRLKKEFKQKLSEIQQGSREDQIQVDLLRELIETVKTTSQQEIKTDNQNSTREEDSMDRARLQDAGGEFVDLSDNLSTQQSQTPAKRNVGVRVSSAMRNVATQQDSVGAVNSVLEQANDIEMFGTGAGILTGIIGTMVAALNIRAKREQSAGTLSALKQTDVDDVLDSEFGQTEFGGYGPGDLGISREQFLSQTAPSTARALGTSQGLQTRAMAGVEIEKAMATDQGTVQSIQQLTRIMTDVASAQELTTKIYSSVYGTGALGQDNQDFARMQDILQGVASFQQGQFMRAGSTDTSGTLSLLRGLQNLGGNFNRDDYTFDTIQRVNSGLSQGGSPEANAIKFDVLRRNNPKKSFFELQAEMEKGIGSENYLSGTLDYVKSTGGNINSQALLFDQLTQGQMRKDDILKILSGDMTLDQIQNKQFDYRGQALKSTSPAQTQLLNFTEQFKDAMSPVGEGVETLIVKVEELIRYIK